MESCAPSFSDGGLNLKKIQFPQWKNVMILNCHIIQDMMIGELILLKLKMSFMHGMTKANQNKNNLEFLNNSSIR